MQTPKKKTILLIAEAVTLAHFARIMTLAKALDTNLYQVVIASDPRYCELETPISCIFRPIRSIPSAEFMRNLAQGKPLYTAKTLIQYVEDDLTLLDHIKPDLVIGDFRLSLAVSAPLRKIPYASVINAYWSPFAEIAYPVPDLPVTQILGTSLTQKLFDIIRPVVFTIHARPLNQVRRHFGLPYLSSDLRDVYSWGDYTLYADIPEVVPTHNLPKHHRYLGPILWSTHTKLPKWWDFLPDDKKPIIFVTLGSSGATKLLPMILASLSELPITIIVATANKATITETHTNTYITDYLPMDIAVQRSELVICNGGSLSTYQALTYGVPVIGLCSNMDQLLNMNELERLGAGILLRAAKVSSTELVSTTNTMLNDLSYLHAAHRIARILEKTDSKQRFRDFVAELFH